MVAPRPRRRPLACGGRAARALTALASHQGHRSDHNDHGEAEPLDGVGEVRPVGQLGGGPTDEADGRSDGSCWMTNGSKGYARESLKRTGSTSPGARGAAIPIPSTSAVSDSRYAR